MIEIYEVKKGIPSEALERKLWSGSKDKSFTNLLSNVVKDNLIPETLTVIELEEFLDFYHQLNIEERVFYDESSEVEPWGFYLNPKCNGQRGLEVLRNKYGVDSDRVIIFPQGKVFYQTYLHEMLHDVFWTMPQEKRKSLVKVTIDECDLNDLREYSCGEGYGERLVDEFISAWFTRQNYFFSRFDKRVMPKKLIDTMEEIGYKVNGAPFVYANEFEEAIIGLLKFSSMFGN